MLDTGILISCWPLFLTLVSSGTGSHGCTHYLLPDLLSLVGCEFFIEYKKNGHRPKEMHYQWNMVGSADAES